MASSAPYARRSFAGGAISTTIPTGMGSADTSFTIAASTGWSFANDFFVVVDRGLSSEEKIECTGIAGLVVSVATRGADGTSAQAHVAGCTVQVCHVAQDDDEANQVVAAVLGQSGAAKGDLLYMLSAAGPNTLARLAIGATGAIPVVSSGVPSWLAIGTTGQLLTVSGGTAAWATPPATGALASGKEVAVLTTSTTVVTYTPSAAGNFFIPGIYFRVITGTTVVTVTMTWTDVTGAQTLTLLNAVSEVTGSYAMVGFMINSAISDAITISMAAGTVSQVIASASILQA
jgi:hypothetical protein